MHIEEYTPLAPMTTFGIGGTARYFVTVYTLQELRDAIAFSRETNVPYTILGGGSNTLFSDHGFDGLVIRLLITKKVVFEHTRTIGAGCVLWDEIKDAAEHGFGGWEKLAGIPGSVGGAVRGNAGAFGTEMKDVVSSVEVLNTHTDEIEVWNNEQCCFDYRYSYFKDHPHLIVLSVTVRLTVIDASTALRSVEDTVAEREKRHLQNVPCAGSFFMNPVAPQWVVDEFESEKKTTSRGGRVPAGWLIEKVGLKGHRIGNACASAMHPNYVMNCGGATAEEVLEVADAIREKVRTEYMTHLFEEVSKVGFLSMSENPRYPIKNRHF